MGNANIWMREMLASPGCPPGPSQSIGTHSCKATLLSWCAKYGLPVADRRLLGYHTKPKDISVLEYSRDAQAGPLRKLVDVLSAIKEGQFQPDATRSGRWVDQPPRLRESRRQAPWRAETCPAETPSRNPRPRHALQAVSVQARLRQACGPSSLLRRAVLLPPLLPPPLLGPLRGWGLGPRGPLGPSVRGGGLLGWPLGVSRPGRAAQRKRQPGRRAARGTSHLKTAWLATRKLWPSPWWP